MTRLEELRERGRERERERERGREGGRREREIMTNLLSTSSGVPS